MNYENCEGTKVFLLFSNIKSENGARRKISLPHRHNGYKKTKNNKTKNKKKTRKRQTKNDPEVYSQVGKILQRETELKRDSEKWKGIQFFAHLTKWRV